jgi:hypothetical protein
MASNNNRQQCTETPFTIDGHQVTIMSNRIPSTNSRCVIRKFNETEFISNPFTKSKQPKYVRIPFSDNYRLNMANPENMKLEYLKIKLKWNITEDEMFGQYKTLHQILRMQRSIAKQYIETINYTPVLIEYTKKCRLVMETYLELENMDPDNSSYQRKIKRLDSLNKALQNKLMEKV